MFALFVRGVCGACVGLGWLGLLSPAGAAIFTYPFTAPSPITTTAQFVDIDTTGASGRARAFYVTGAWSLAGGDPFSNEFRVQLAGVTGVGGGAVERLHGGAGNGNPFTFSAPSVATWVNNVTTGPTGLGYNTMLADVPTSDLGGVFSLGLRQTFAGSSANLANAEVHFLTDIFSPVAFNTGASGLTMPARPNSLTSTITGAGGGYRYDLFSFVAPATGPLHIAMQISPSADGYLLVYNGSFDPNAPLTNLVGIDDVGGLGDPNSADLFLGVTQGQTYTVVATSFLSINGPAPLIIGQFTVAGVIPEPASLALLGLGGLALLRRRRA